MATPVYLNVLGIGFTEAYYQLSKEEQTNLWSKVDEIGKRAGEKWLITCNSRWADESIFDWGVLEYPSMEAYLQKVRELEKIEFYRYWQSKTILGTKFEE